MLNDIMVKHVEAMRQKNITFSFLVDDLSTYKNIAQLKAENPEIFKDHPNPRTIPPADVLRPTSMPSTRDSRDLEW